MYHKCKSRVFVRIPTSILSEVGIGDSALHPRCGRIFFPEGKIQAIFYCNKCERDVPLNEIFEECDYCEKIYPVDELFQIVNNGVICCQTCMKKFPVKIEVKKISEIFEFVEIRR